VQKPLHAVVASQAYGTHGLVVGEPQLPAPSQYAIDVLTPDAHAAATHEVLVPGGVPHAMRFEPSHCAWHAPVPGHALRAPCGGPATVVH
jgi:hypothetical protein